MKTSPLQLNQTLIGELTLKPFDAKPTASSVDVTTTPAFARADENPRMWLVKLRVAFKGANQEPAPYEGSIDVSGVFTVAADWPEEKHLKLVAVSCPTLLYSTARELIASITARGKHGVFLLPSISFSNLIITPEQTKAGATPAAAT